MQSERDLDTKASMDWYTGILLQDPSKIDSKATTALNHRTTPPPLEFFAFKTSFSSNFTSNGRRPNPSKTFLFVPPSDVSCALQMSRSRNNFQQGNSSRRKKTQLEIPDFISHGHTSASRSVLFVSGLIQTPQEEEIRLIATVMLMSNIWCVSGFIGNLWLFHFL